MSVKWIDKRNEFVIIITLLEYIDNSDMAPWPSGKAKVCNTSITSSNLVGALENPCFFETRIFSLKTKIDKPDHWKEYDTNTNAYVMYTYKEKGFVDLDEVNFKCLVEYLNENLFEFCVAKHIYILRHTQSCSTAPSYSINMSTGTAVPSSSWHEVQLVIDEYEDFLLYKFKMLKNIKPRVPRKPKEQEWA